MTTLAADTVRPFELGEFNDLPMIASDIIYEGAAVGDNGSGYARPLVAGDRFYGFATAKADNSGSAVDGAINVRVRMHGLVQIPVTGVDGVDDVGKEVYASDDNAFTLTKSTNSAIGRIHRHVSGTTAVVAFDARKAGFGTFTALTDDSGGTAGDTIAAIGGTYTQSEVRNAVASLAAKINELAARLK